MRGTSKETEEQQPAGEGRTQKSMIRMWSTGQVPPTGYRCQGLLAKRLLVTLARGQGFLFGAEGGVSECSVFGSK